jgi:hypothetical protein|tara:strand:+ start:449 stop:622 length:174 start_codon:yes stop_codon:yes gene_type:complete
MSNEFVPDFTQREYGKIIEAVERRQRNYICGDASYKELGNIADELKRRQASAIQFKC